MASAARLAMPALPPGVFTQAMVDLVAACEPVIPAAGKGSLYLRPVIMATEPRLGVRPADEYLFVTIASPVADYFGNADASLNVTLSGDVPRAFPGGTGAAKCAGNYAASLNRYSQARADGYDQVVWLDAVEHTYVEE